MTDRYTITELVMTKGTSAPVRVALLEMEKKIIALEAENERLRGLVQGWHYLAVGPDEMGDYYTHKQLIKASEPYAHPALRGLGETK